MTEIHLEPYHPFGLSKYRSIGREVSYSNEELLSKPDAERIRDYIAGFTQKSVVVS